MSDKGLTLQQDCNSVVFALEEAISKINAAADEPDIDTADKLFHKTLATLIDNLSHIVLHGATWDDIKASIKPDIKADMPY